MAKRRSGSAKASGNKVDASVAQVSPQYNFQLAKEIQAFVHDPLGYVKFVYPWSEKGALYSYKGPQKWQEDTLNTIRDALKKDPYEPIRIARSSGHGVGKGLCVSDVIDTPNGRRVWGSIKVGDKVFGADGCPAKVIAVHYRGVLPMYRVTFDDGSSVVCDADHLWSVQGRNSRRTGAMTYKTISTSEIMRRGVKRSNGDSANKTYGGAKQWAIPIQGAAQFPEKEVLIAPYVLGAWIGNGAANTPKIAIADDCPETIQQINILGYDYSLYRSHDAKCQSAYLKGVINLFRDQDCFNKHSYERFVPDNYKYNSPAVRLELLRGLLDTDGECNSHGSVVYGSTSKQLTEDVIWLARSLGGKARMQPTIKRGRYRDADGNLVECRDFYRATLQLPPGMDPFYVQKKLTRVRDVNERYLTRWIESIEYEKDDEVMCITVDKEDGLYLANDFIVTHNSALVAWIIEWAMATCPNCRVLVTANTQQQLMTKTWPEMNVWHNRSLVGHWFTVTSSSMYYSLDKGYEKTWMTNAVTWSVGNTEAFAGLHNKGNRIVIIIDEASAVIDSIWEVIEGALTDADTEILWLVFGNPTRNSGRFRECFRRFKSLWNTARVDSRTVEVTNKRLYKEWAASYGEDSDFYRVRVTGEFPDQATGQLISSAIVRDAMERDCDIKDITENQPKILGVDIAREGEDASSVWLRQGLYSKRLLKTTKLSTATLSAQLAAIIDKEKPDQVFLDMGNVGAAVFDSLKSWGYKDITGIYFQNSPADGRIYANKRIEMWDKMRIWLENGGMLPRANATDGSGLDIENDLIAPEFFYNRSGKKMLESKKDMKARGIPSTDDGDALSLTFSSTVYAKRDKISLPGSHSANKAMGEWDPFNW